MEKPAVKTKFTESERVLCFHGPLIYEAKCLKVQAKDKQIKYFIHYAGWNKNWDEWVPESRVLKLNDANISRQKDLQKAHEASLRNKKSKKRKEKIPKRAHQGRRRRRRGGGWPWPWRAGGWDRSSARGGGAGEHYRTPHGPLHRVRGGG